MSWFPDALHPWVGYQKTSYISPAAALDQIREAQDAIGSATERLNQAVVFARASGKTWAEIGAAAGMSRQSAHDRWGR